MSIIGNGYTYPFCRKYHYFNFYCNVLYHYYYTFDVQSKLQQVAIDNIDDHTSTTQYYTYKGLPFEVIVLLEPVSSFISLFFYDYKA